MLRPLLDVLTNLWQIRDSPILEKLAEGIKVANPELVNFTGSFPENAIDLYHWKNGIKPDNPEELIGTICVFEGGIPPFNRHGQLDSENNGRSPTGVAIFDVSHF